MGVNAYQGDDGARDLERLKADPDVEERQRTRLSALRAQRHRGAVASRLSGIQVAARLNNEALMGFSIDAVTAGCTLGEIWGGLRADWEST